MRLGLTALLLLITQSACLECGRSVNLGKIELAESSRAFIPYDGTETLIFEDQNGDTYTLTSENGRESQDLILRVRTLCDEGPIDQQHEFHEIQREEVAFLDAQGNQVFYITLATSYEEASLPDSIAMFDHLRVSVSIDGRSTGEISIITHEHQGEVSNAHRNDFLNHSRLIGDTTLYGKEFTGVYEGQSVGDGKSTFFNVTEGVLALKIDEEAYWVLRE